jgi:hypothetical protein
MRDLSSATWSANQRLNTRGQIWPLSKSQTSGNLASAGEKLASSWRYRTQKTEIGKRHCHGACADRDIGTGKPILAQRLLAAPRRKPEAAHGPEYLDWISTGRQIEFCKSFVKRRASHPNLKTAKWKPKQLSSPVMRLNRDREIDAERTSREKEIETTSAACWKTQENET